METAQLYNIYQAHRGVTIDSRKVETGSIFFALQGANSDGNSFASKALEAGASYAIIDNAKYQQRDDDRFILVDNVLASLQQLAKYHRQQFEIPVIAITGSNGKTTTKELVSGVLGTRYITHFTKGNFNNHIGLPLTLLQMMDDVEVAVIEMGANHIGEIEELCKIAEPTHGVITNIGKAHLEGFGSLEGVKQGKSELYQYLSKRGGTAFINLDEKYLLDLSNKVGHRIFYKKSERPDPASSILETKLIGTSSFLKIGFQSEMKLPVLVNSQMIGIYNFNNIMTAVSIGRYFKVPAKQIKAAIESYIPKDNRSQLIKIETNTYILDAYNANPTSLQNALMHFARAPYKRKIVIMGDMLELGKYSFEEHKTLLTLAAEQDFEKIITVGSAFQQAGAREYDRVLSFSDVEGLKIWFETQEFSETAFLLKGSRGIGLEKLLKNKIADH